MKPEKLVELSVSREIWESFAFIFSDLKMY